MRRLQESRSSGRSLSSQLQDATDRIEAWGAALERDSIPGDEERIRVLSERARLLAREPKRVSEGANLDVVEFLLGHERYAFESSCVSEVHPLRDLTPLPGTPAFVLGIVNLRGQLLPVIDLGRFLDLRKREETEHSRIIVLQVDGVRLGVVADSIAGVRSIELDQIHASLMTLTGLSAESLKGVDGDRLAILDARSIMSDERLIVCDEVEA